jgi:transposase
MSFYISKEDLEDLYFVDGLSYSEIEKKLNLKRGVIYHWFKKYEIKSRSYSEAGKGRKFTEEHKNKIASSNSKPHTEERKKNISNAHLGKKISKEHKDKIRLKLLGLRVGHNHPMWRGGTSIMRNRLRQSYVYKNWRNVIYERDNYTCQLCFSSKKYLNCHHIETFSSIVDRYKLESYDDYLNCLLLWDIDNGITLCKNCHESIKNKEIEYEQKFKNRIYEKKKNV